MRMSTASAMIYLCYIKAAFQRFGDTLSMRPGAEL